MYMLAKATALIVNSGSSRSVLHPQKPSRLLNRLTKIPVHKGAWGLAQITLWRESS